ncbi:MAG: hypothetical protein SFV17_16075 [Candidatus Obscuribacter sp.]|nr:hypothetical protein [Candidatus Obscuribacter sp.]
MNLAFILCITVVVSTGICTSPSFATHINEKEKLEGSCLGSQNQNINFQIEDYAVFLSPENENSCRTISRQYRLLYFSDAEKETLARRLKAIYDKCPQLLMVCSSGNTIDLCKVKHAGFVASSSGGKLLISERFFDGDHKTQQEHELMHELVHLADSACTTAYSREWANFILPRIKAINKIRLLMDGESTRKFEIYLQEQDVLPSLYASVNLREALAEFFCAHFEGKKFQHSKQIVLQVVSSDTASLESRAIARSAIQASWSHNYQKAIDLCKLVKGLHPTLAYLIGINESKQGHTQIALEAFTSASSLFESLGIDCNEDWFRMCQYEKSKIHIERGEIDRALGSLASILRELPNDRKSLVYSSQCAEVLGQWSYSLRSKYAALGYITENESLYKLSESAVVTDVILKKLSSKESSSHRSLKGDLFRLRALRTQNIAERNNLLSNAITQYQSAMHAENPDKRSLLDKLIAASLSIGNIRMAKEYYIQAERLYSDDILLKIDRVALLEKEGDTTKAHAQFLLLRKEIEQMPAQAQASVSQSLELFSLQEIIELNLLKALLNE